MRASYAERASSHNNQQGREPAQPTQEKFDKMVPMSEVVNAVPHIETEEPQAQERLKLENPPRKRKRLPCDGETNTDKAQIPAEGGQQKRTSRRARKRHRHGTPPAETGDRPDAPEVDLGDSKDSCIATKL